MPTSQPVKIGLIGAGRIANAHVNGYLAIPERATITAVADVSAENTRRRVDQAGGAKTYADYHELITTADVDAVDICLPHHLHADAIITAAKAGKHILCEKPLCITAEEAAAVTAAVRENNVTLMCAHNQLFMPPRDKSARADHQRHPRQGVRAAGDPQLLQQRPGRGHGVARQPRHCRRRRGHRHWIPHDVPAAAPRHE